MCALAFYISDSVNTLSRAKELAIDVTFGTNNTGMDLFAVLAEVDGTGIPLAYGFMDVFKDNSQGVRQVEPGATTNLLDQFLQPLCEAGFNPTCNRTTPRYRGTVQRGPVQCGPAIAARHKWGIVQLDSING